MKKAGTALTLSIQPPPLDGAIVSLSGTYVDQFVPCTATDQSTCQIVPNLPALNELLFASHLELRELPDRCGQLSLSSFSHCGLLAPHSPQAELIFWLLTAHRCIVAVHVWISPFDCHTASLCRTLQRNLWLKALKLQLYEFVSYHEICAAIACSPDLEELELSMHRECPAELASALSALFLRASAPLVSLKLNGVLMVGKSIKAVLEALVRNSTLKKLDITGSLVWESFREQFVAYLTSTTGLTRVSMDSGSELEQKALLQGVLHNRTISKLSLKCFVGNEESARLIARIFRENAVLRSFHILSTKRNLTRQHESVYDCWLKELSKNCTLEELTLPFLIWHPVKWASFSKILSTKLSLKEVYFEKGYSNYSFLHSVSAALTESGADETVSLGSYHVEHNLDLIKCKAFSEIYLFSNGFEHVRVAALLELPHCSHLTFLAMYVKRGDTTLSSALADCLTSTSCQLRKLQLSVGFAGHIQNTQPNIWWATISNSVARNRSIKEISVSMINMSNKEFKDLADAVKCSRSIRTVNVKDETSGNPTAFVRCLSTDIVDNYTLLPVCLNGGLDADASKEWFTIHEETLRNCGVLARTARFTKYGQFDRYIAAAVECISQHPALLEDVAELACISKDEAAVSIRNCIRIIEPMDEFMKLTGVVKERVSCHPRDGMHMQLDQLDEHCWNLVRRYLTLEDIKYGAAQPVYM
ncbi:hypothetical protein V5799_032114 [Amblyomma americanum]|uniref:Nlr family card domain protein n=1 Tax=Amblyomma americanum TaxID=6943 RepID=A0AAQ4DS38_AMBAM